MAQAAPSHSKGRPRLTVDRDQLESLRNLHFSWETISSIMGVSVKTLQRRAKEWDIITFTSITDADLDRIVERYQHEFPQAGEAMLRGHLQSLDIHIQRERLRMSVQRMFGSGNSRHPPKSRRNLLCAWAQYTMAH